MRLLMYLSFFAFGFFNCMQNKPVICGEFDNKENNDQSIFNSDKGIYEAVSDFIWQKREFHSGHLAFTCESETARSNQFDCESVSHYPQDFVSTVLEAEKMAPMIISNRTWSQFLDLLRTACLKRPGMNADPYVVFCLIKAVMDECCPKNDLDLSQRAFQLMARLVMGAPFMRFISNSYKHVKGSQEVFSDLTQELPWVETYKRNNNDYVVDAWQIYFTDIGYPMHVIANLEALYHFYIEQAQWLMNLNDPFSDPESFFEILSKKLKRGSLYEDNGDFNSEYIKYELDSTEANKEYSISDILDRIGDNYLIIDIDIYWYLIRHLFNKPREIKERFINLMVSRGANIDTLIDIKGNTPMILLTEIYRREKEASAAVALSQSGVARSRPNRKKRLSSDCQRTHRVKKQLPQVAKRWCNKTSPQKGAFQVLMDNEESEHQNLTN